MFSFFAGWIFSYFISNISFVGITTGLSKLCFIALVPQVCLRAYNWKEELEKPLETYEYCMVRYKGSRV